MPISLQWHCSIVSPSCPERHRFTRRYRDGMARVWIDDLWLKNDNGVPPSSTAKRSLAAVSDPMRAQVPERWRSSRYGHGMRWRCRWYTVEGTAHRQHSKSFAKLTDAEAFKAAMEDDVRRGRYTNPADSQRKFKDAAEMWLRSKNNVSEGGAGTLRMRAARLRQPQMVRRPHRIHHLG